MEEVCIYSGAKIRLPEYHDGLVVIDLGGLRMAKSEFQIASKTVEDDKNSIPTRPSNSVNIAIKNGGIYASGQNKSRMKCLYPVVEPVLKSFITKGSRYVNGVEIYAPFTLFEMSKLVDVNEEIGLHNNNQPESRTLKEIAKICDSHEQRIKKLEEIIENQNNTIHPWTIIGSDRPYQYVLCSESKSESKDGNYSRDEISCFIAEMRNLAGDISSAYPYSDGVNEPPTPEQFKSSLYTGIMRLCDIVDNSNV